MKTIVKSFFIRRKLSLAFSFFSRDRSKPSTDQRRIFLKKGRYLRSAWFPCRHWIAGTYVQITPGGLVTILVLFLTTRQRASQFVHTKRIYVPLLLSNNVMGYHTSPSNDLSNRCVRTKDTRSTGYKRHRPRAIIWPETRFSTRLALYYHFS